MRYLFLFYFLYGVVGGSDLDSDSMSITWEYGNCAESTPNYITCNYDSNEILLPIFKYPIPTKALDSLSSKFNSKYLVNLKDGLTIMTETFGEFYYSDSLIVLTLYESYLSNGGYFSYAGYLDYSKNGLSEDHSYWFIYVREIGIVYVSYTPIATPSEAKMARLLGTYKMPNREWEKMYRNIMNGYFHMDCFN